jgi:Spy/CpxP family protein refolding chaperone
LRERLAERLGLTEDQQDKMRVIRLEQRKEQTLRRGKLAGLRSELQVEFMEAQVDRGRVLGLQGQISDLQATMARSRLEGRLDLLEVLSPEQRETWMEMRREAPGMFRRGMDRVRRHHPGRGFGWAPEAPGPGDDLGEAFDLEDLLLEDDLAR